MAKDYFKRFGNSLWIFAVICAAVYTFGLRDVSSQVTPAKPGTGSAVNPTGNGGALTNTLGTNGFQFLSPADGSGDPALLPFITKPLFNGVIGQTHNASVAALWWNFGGTSNSWLGRWVMEQSLYIGDQNKMPPIHDGNFPFIVTANGAVENQTNGLNNTNAQGTIRCFNWSAYANNAIYFAMHTNTGTIAGQPNLTTVVDPNCVQFGTANMNLPENLSGGTVGIIADPGPWTWAFAVPENIGSDSINPNHTWLAYQSNIFSIEGKQGGVYSATNPAAIHALSVYTMGPATFGNRAYGAAVWSNLFVGGSIFLGQAGAGQGITIYHGGLGYLQSAAMEPTGTMTQTNFNCNQTSSTPGLAGFGWAGGPRIRSDASGDFRFDMNTTQIASLLSGTGNFRLETSGAQYLLGASGDVGIARVGAAALKVTDGSTGTGTITVKQSFGTQVNIPGTVIDWAAGTDQYTTLTGNITFTFANPADTLSVVVQITGDASHTVTWPGTINWVGTTGRLAPTQTLSKTDIYTFKQINGIVSGTVAQ